VRPSILVLEDWIRVFIGLSTRQVRCGFICGEDGAGEGGGGVPDMYALWYAGRLVGRMDIEEEGEGLTSPGVATSSGTPAMPRSSFVPGRANGEAVRSRVWGLKLQEFSV